VGLIPGARVRTGRAWLLASALASSVALVSVAIGPGAPAVAGAGPMTTPGPTHLDVVQRAGGVVHPLSLEVHALDANGVPLLSTAGPTGYTPARIRASLGLTGTGAGQTIAIVVAYNHPNIAADLATFDSTFGLPAPPSFKKVSQSGSTTSLPVTDAGWALETSLDVEWAHAIAPGAGILLVEATSSSFANLDTAIAYAAKQSAVTVISNSWGATEFNGETTLDSYCKQSAKLCVFSSGDNGNPAAYPSTSPYVLSVGGTTLQLASDNTIASETAWSGSGGGTSLYETKPAYQNAVNTTLKRGAPDVSYNADPATGVAVYDSVPYAGQSGWFQMGGTSAGAPQWAGIVAVADQLRKAAGKTVLAAYTSKGVFQAHTAIYGAASGLADVTTGTNGTCGSVCTTAPGYDFVTGRGSPRPGIDVALKNAT
jgi:subtilase family serine protease